ncbi:hypothetical protein FHS51_002021 [Sphingobium wenxiniae]|uniref:Uncharacterized protein n=1 Tax=Sphingobium baderi LL03 TaxID=1114964 RepID=T0GEC7_9SPHN|nr:hypothetical protein L485_15875 [Sphingobium baderi LL03]KMS61601.1 hypothetical protein V475_14565 [Sphingobium baderi LL03]MBB6191792.1 hypothetical protein [Sphingobium wenxiniae]
MKTHAHDWMGRIGRPARRVLERMAHPAGLLQPNRYPD